MHMLFYNLTIIFGNQKKIGTTLILSHKSYEFMINFLFLHGTIINHNQQSTGESFFSEVKESNIHLQPPNIKV